jgi:hypothetical protein
MCSGSVVIGMSAKKGVITITKEPLFDVMAQERHAAVAS